MTIKTTEKILESVEALQAIQKRHHPESVEWRHASRQLAPMFAELASRQRAGEAIR